MSSTWDFARWRRDFQHWRRGRPFWAGLLLIASGIELLLSANMDLGDIEIHLGYEGFLSYLLPALMLLTGIFVWFTPKQRVFYGIIGTLTAIYSLIGLNLGGFLLGMLLGIIGGGMAFAWTPGATDADDSDHDSGGPSAGGKEAESGSDAPTWTVRPVGGQHRAADETLVESRSRKFLARWAFRLSILLVVAAGLVPAVPASYADTCPTVAPTPSPSPTASPTPSPTQTRRTLWDLWVEFWERQGSGQTATPPPGPTPTASPSPSCTPTPGTSTTGPGGPGSTDGPAPTGSGTAAANPSGSPEPDQALPFTVAAGVPRVGARPAHMTVSRLTLLGFAVHGVTELNTANGPLRVMHISADRATNENFRLAIQDPDDGTERVIINSDPLVARGSAQIYTTRFAARILGIPIVLTPDLPLPPLPLPLPIPLVFTDVDMQLVFLDCQVLEGAGLNLRDPSAV